MIGETGRNGWSRRGRVGAARGRHARRDRRRGRPGARAVLRVTVLLGWAVRLVMGFSEPAP
ncbi:hypothetical protein ACQEU5_23965 [Marinactinospora thermotolerans]|uniref:hypothetical protein n=1 Tax=Marinactinospora thermotolerans TaxID=531310 RepID=UPI0011864485|nr:hypothetical protein [Marinactinospora thermotolerans]